MAIYKELPDINSEYFKLKSYGGYYDGIKGSPEVYKGSGLNNCCCAAWGLFAMAENKPLCLVGCEGRTTTKPYNAGEWYGLKDEYKRGLEPVEGALICFTNHIAFVNEVLSNGDIIIIESGYGAKNYNGLWYKKLLKEENYYRGAIYGDFVGFIYPKENSKTEEEITLEQAIKRMAEEVIKGTYGNGKIKRSAALYSAIQAKVNELMKG